MAIGWKQSSFNFVSVEYDYVKCNITNARIYEPKYMHIVYDIVKIVFIHYISTFFLYTFVAIKYEILFMKYRFIVIFFNVFFIEIKQMIKVQNIEI